MLVSYSVSNRERTDIAGCRLYGSKASHLYLRLFQCLPCLLWQVHGIRDLGIAGKKEVRSVRSVKGTCPKHDQVQSTSMKVTYLVKEPLGVMGPGNRRKLYKPDLVTETACVVVDVFPVDSGKRLAGLTNINRAKVATLQSVSMAVSQP